MTPPPEVFLIFCADARSSDFAVWWGPNRAGYTSDLDKAGRYTRDEYEAAVPGAARAWNIAVPVAAAEREARRVVRARDLPAEVPV